MRKAGKNGSSSGHHERFKARKCCSWELSPAETPEGGAVCEDLEVQRGGECLTLRLNPEGMAAEPVPWAHVPGDFSFFDIYTK